MRQLFPEPVRSLDDRAAVEAAYATPPEPSVRANFIVSLDGAIEVGGTSAALGGPEDQDLFAALRAVADVVLVGASTVRAEHYGPAKVAPPARERRQARGQAVLPTVAVVTRSADLDPDSLLFSGEPLRGTVPPRPLIVTCDAAPMDRRRRLAEVAEVLVCGGGSVELPSALAELRRRGLAQVLCEGGPTLFTLLVTEGLVDELCLTHSPVLAGPGHQPLLAAAELSGGAASRALGLLAAYDQIFLGTGGGLLFARYRARPARAAGAA